MAGLTEQVLVKANRAGRKTANSTTRTPPRTKPARFLVVKSFACRGNQTATKRSAVTHTRHMALNEAKKETVNWWTLQRSNPGNGWPRTGMAQSKEFQVIRQTVSHSVKTARYNPVEVVRMSLETITIKLSRLFTKPIANITGKPYIRPALIKSG